MQIADNQFGVYALKNDVFFILTAHRSEQGNVIVRISKCLKKLVIFMEQALSKEESPHVAKSLD